jgi:hypothetical protein
MKVPKMYKSSDRYNAGTDVIYNDDSKLQYAPFIYATTGSGDSGDDGGDGGDDEEGEEAMLIHINTDSELDKNYKEISDAVASGKVVYAILDMGEGEVVTSRNVYYLTHQEIDGETYIVQLTSMTQGTPPLGDVLEFTADSETGVLSASA